MRHSLVVAVSLFLLASSGSAAPYAPGKPAPKPAAKPAPKPAPKPALKPAAKPAPKPANPEPIAVPEPAAPPEPVAAPVETGPKTWALLVGVSEYQSPQISSLRFPATDATSLRDALTDPKVGGLPASQVLLLADADATRAKITGAVNTFLRSNVKSGDKIVVFLAGHGVAKGVGLNSKGYLLPTDVTGLETPALESSAVSLRALADDLATLPASQFVVFVDACREDPSPGRGVKGNALSDVLARGIIVVPKNEAAQSATFFACSIGQRAFEDRKYGHGVFTQWILEGLQQGAIAQQTDGAVDMGRLSSYVSGKVSDWAKETSAAGNTNIVQTPELIATQLSEPLILLRVKREVTEAPIAPMSPRIFVAASPDSAQISINGTRAGVGSLEKTLPAEGEVTIDVSAPGYAPVSRSVNALGGYEQQIVVQLQPSGAGGATSAPDEHALDFYRRALDAQEREQYEIAEQGYKAAIGADAKFVPAYESLIDLHHLQDRNLNVVGDALSLVSNTARDAHTLSTLSRAYSEFATRGEGLDNAATALPTVANYGQPKDVADAAKLAVRAAGDALKLDANSPEANLAQGYALAALDLKGKNKTAALAAFGKAAFLEPTNADTHLGLGYGIRFYALQLKKDDQKRAEINRAIIALNDALKLRPNYYEAHRELAFCYIALGDNAAALNECKLARSNRGDASDPNEIASIEVAMSGLHQQVAQNSTGDEKAANEAASQGYLADAKETAPNADLTAAMSILNSAGLSTSLSSYLPTELRPLLDIRGAAQNAIRNAIPGGLGGLGGIFR